MASTGEEALHAYVCLVRGINVGGHHKVPMAAWRESLEGLGFGSVRTYVQSGNAVFSASATEVAVAKSVRAAMERDFGFSPPVMVLSRKRFAAIVAACPFRAEAEAAPTAVHVFFLDGALPTETIDSLAAAPRATERLEVTHEAVYLHTPDGFGRSKFADLAVRKLGKQATARNWNTVIALSELLASDSESS